ncbi:uncharacterized protein BKA55DRAFT_88241 [Fusarium redolens]|jgi:hypothetical protein|uniref:Uncharacterized protein n=1 Tax=Fusarium redolens TaxID=48865 RepID=A0A9P9GR67_FUSRE|nr:uncharacterized protein BKA55DRAFT_88241 [Fusarium redolens]KAH7243272.1 hypothetical protein BKA55DRAFT_88241 [Fusarium redolens]
MPLHHPLLVSFFFILLSSQAFILVIISLEWSLCQVSFGLLRFLSVPLFNFLFTSSTSIIISRRFSILALFSNAISSLVALNFVSLFESVSAFSTSVCRSSILVHTKLQKSTISTPSFSLSTSSHLHQIKPPHVSQPATIKPRPPSRSAPVLQCQTVRTRNNSIAPLRKLASSFASPSTVSWRIQTLEFPL